MGVFTSPQGVPYSLSEYEFRREENTRSAQKLSSLWAEKFFPEIFELDYNKPEDDEVSGGDFNRMAIMFARLAIVQMGGDIQTSVRFDPTNRQYAKLIEIGFLSASKFDFETIERFHMLNRALWHEGYWDGTPKEEVARDFRKTWLEAHPEHNPSD